MGLPKIESKADVEDGDYLQNIAFVGKTLGGKNIIVIMDNALCTSGLESNGENKKEGVGTYTFACHADLDSDLDTLPYHIYYPKIFTILIFKIHTPDFIITQVVCIL